MPRHDPRVRLLHMRDYAQKAVDMISELTREDLDRDGNLRLALTHLVELVGEAASRIPDDVRTLHPEIPWAKAIGMRHRLIHGYGFVDYDILWNTVTGSLPGLIESLDEILGRER